jgi:CMP-2-keto-3-deoxyoctulosonic acid synthetase
MNTDEAKQLANSCDRKEHTARLLRETNPPKVVVVNTEGEQPILEREWVSQFNGS